MATKNTDSSSSTTAFRLEWDVFLSFSGEDTRQCFTTRLHEALKERGVRAFLDDDGGEIAPSQAIEDSAAAIVIFSPRYAESHLCLEELAKISECRGKLVLPVFWHVDPSHVRRQRGPFEDHFRAHVERFGEEKVERWRRAMERVGGIAGWPVSAANNSQEAKIIQSLVKSVLSAIRKTPVSLADYTVGLETKVEELIKLLDVKSNGVRVLGLYGIGGIGKTTLAKALFNRLVSHGFKIRSFIPNVREVSTQEDGLKLLQNKLIDDISKGLKTIEDEINSIFKREMNSNEKRVLVVLDDVDNVSQLNALMTDRREFLCEGSRFIITTRNKEVLREHIVNVKYEVRELDSDKALQLFSYHALRREKPAENFLNLSEQIVSLTGGLPLALEVFGSMLFDKRREEEWKDALQKLKQIRPKDLQDVLKISYDGLDEKKKCVFLDIACLFANIRMDKDYAIDIFNGCGFDAEIAIADLTAKSLIKIAEENSLWMHDQVRDMARQIVKHENILDPCMRSRLWYRDDIINVFLDDKRRKSTQGIVLDFKRKSIVKDVDGKRIAWQNLQKSPNLTNTFTYLKETYKQYKQNQAEKRKEVTFRTKPLKTMPNLRLLQVNYVNLEGQFSFPEELKWLQWKQCPLKYLPSDFSALGLAVLDLSDSKIQRIWSNWCGKKVADNLKVLKLNECPYLVALPNLSRNQKLKKLLLKNCVSLEKLDEHIGNMNTLVHLDLEGCRNLIKFPSHVTGLKCLEYLILSGCSKLKELPLDIGTMISLKVLLVDRTAIENLPESIFRLTKLEKLNLNRCERLRRLPHCIGKLCSLNDLSLNGSGIEEFPSSIGSLENLEKLSAMWCLSLSILPDSLDNLKLLTDLLITSSPIKELPDCVGSLPNLKELALGKGKFLNKLPYSIGGLNSLVTLQIDETSITYLPDQIGGLKSLKKLRLFKCESLVSLPESIGDMLSLTNLVIYKGKVRELPESIGMLENLIELRLTFCKDLQKLPASIGKLKSLQRLSLQETAVTELPENFGMLSSLIVLNVSKNPWIGNDDKSIQLAAPSAHDGVFFPASFANLSLLTKLDVHARKIAGKIPDDFEMLASLEILNLGHNDICSLPSSLRGLSILKELLLSHCRNLKSLPPLPSSLLTVDASQCISLEYVSDLSNLESLEELNLTNCEKVEDIPGLECLKSLKRLFMSCCNTCSLVTKRRLAKASLRKIRNLSMPGSKIPDWFSQDVVTYKERRNRPIKGVTIAVVVSLNHQIQDDMRDRLPAIVDIQAQILKNENFPVFSTVFNLRGVPNRSEDQLHLCRYAAHTPLVFQLIDGYKIVVTKKNPPHMKGVELKKSGIHLIYEGDDDYEGDEESLNESQQSISEKLAKFFSSFEDDESSFEARTRSARE